MEELGAKADHIYEQKRDDGLEINDEPKIRRFEFNITIIGSGETIEKAWQDAFEAFWDEPGPVPDDYIETDEDDNEIVSISEPLQSFEQDNMNKIAGPLKETFGNTEEEPCKKCNFSIMSKECFTNRNCELEKET